MVTGSAGFIGGRFGGYAAEAGHDVIGTGRSAGPGHRWPGLYRQSSGTVDAFRLLIEEFKPDLVFHGAGASSVAGSLADPLNDFNGSVQLFTNLLEGLRRSGHQALLIFPSSAAVYGNPDVLPASEDAAIQPISPYGFHKAICEFIAREYAVCFDVNVVVCRLFSVFGSAQRRLLLWDLFKRLSGPESVVTLEGSGAASRDFLSVDDAVGAMFLLADAFARESRAAALQIVNVASGVETSVADLAYQMRDLVAPSKQVVFRGAVRKGDPLNWRGDISRLNSLVPSWKPTRLNEALKTCVNSWQQESAALQHNA